MDFQSLQRKVKQMIDRRGGTESVKADAEELRDIAQGPGSLSDKAKRAGDALKDPGARGPDTPGADEPGRPERGPEPSTGSAAPKPTDPPGA